MEQVRSNNPQHMQWLLRPPVLVIAIMFSLYLVVAITTPLNIDSMNALDGKPIIRFQPFLPPPQKTDTVDININGTVPTGVVKSMKEDKGIVGKVANATSDLLVYKNIIDGRGIPVGVDGAKVSKAVIRNRGTIQRFVPLSLFIVVGLIGIQIAKYYIMRSRSFTDGINSTQFGALASRSALSRLLQQPNFTRRGLSHRIRNMSQADRVRLQLALSSRDFTGDDYERLLQLDSADFNRGATEGQINRLPTSIYSGNTSSSSSSNHSSPLRNRAVNDINAPIRRENSYGGSSSSSSVDDVGDEWKEVDIDDREREGEQLTARSTQCAICLEPYQDGDELRTVMCLHHFHKNCIDQWLRTNCICPICKQRSVE